MKKKIEEDMSEDEILYSLLKKKVGSVSKEDVFYFKDGQNSIGQKVTTYHLGGKKISPNVASQLRSEAKAFKTMQLYKVFTETMKNTAHLHMFTLMKTLDDQHYGKAILYSIDLMEKIIDSLDDMPSVDKP